MNDDGDGLVDVAVGSLTTDQLHELIDEAGRAGDLAAVTLYTAASIAPTLYDYRTGDAIRPATDDELAASIAAAERDGGAGVIVVDGIGCYVGE